MDTIKIFIADDSPVARSMLVRLLANESDIQVVGEAGSGQGSIIMLDELAPDIVLLEAKISGGMNINNVVQEMKKMRPDVIIILCIDANDGDMVMTAARYGAADFIRKPYVKTAILRAIRQAYADRT